MQHFMYLYLLSSDSCLSSSRNLASFQRIAPFNAMIAAPTIGIATPQRPTSLRSSLSALLFLFTIKLTAFTEAPVKSSPVTIPEAIPCNLRIITRAFFSELPEQIQGGIIEFYLLEHIKYNKFFLI